MRWLQRSVIISLVKTFHRIGSRYPLAGVAAFAFLSKHAGGRNLSAFSSFSERKTSSCLFSPFEKLGHLRIEPSDDTRAYAPTSGENSGTLQAINCGRGKTSDLLEMGAADKQRGRCYGGISIHSVASMRVSDSFCLCMGQSYNENLGLSR